MRNTFLAIIPLCYIGIIGCDSNQGNTVESKTEPKQKADSNLNLDTFNSTYSTLDTVKTLTKIDTLLGKIDRNEIKVLFHAIGTEPFWRIYITPTDVIFLDEGNYIKQLFKLESKFDATLKKQEMHCISNEGEKITFTITHENGSDGMSNRIFPYTIVFNDYHGAGDCMLMNDWSKYETE